MSEENGGKDPMPAPPSFIPSCRTEEDGITASQVHNSFSIRLSVNSEFFACRTASALKCPARQQAYSATIIRNSIRFQRSTEFPSCRKLHQQTT